MPILSFRSLTILVTGLVLATPSFAQDYRAVFGQTMDAEIATEQNRSFLVDAPLFEVTNFQAVYAPAIESSGAVYSPVEPISDMNLWNSLGLERSNFTDERAVYMAPAGFGEERVSFDAASLAKALGEKVPKYGL